MRVTVAAAAADKSSQGNNIPAGEEEVQWAHGIEYREAREG